MNRALVVCIGNRLVGDDGFGPQVFDALARESLPPHVHVRLLETRGIALLDELDGPDLLIVVDAVQLGAAPGTLHVLESETLRDVARMPVTSHDIALNEALAVCGVLYPERLPSNVLFIGVEGCDFSLLGAPLSPAVARTIPSVVQKIQTACLGVAALSSDDLNR